MWQEYERDAWLGPALEQMTDEQLEAFDDAARQIFDRYPATDDDPDAATEALSGALMVILGDDTLDGLGGAYRQADRCGDRVPRPRTVGDLPPVGAVPGVGHQGAALTLADLHMSRKREKAPTRALGAGGGSWFACAGSGSGK